MLRGLELGEDGVLLVLAERIATGPGSGSGSGGSGGHIIAENGSPFPQRGTLDFLGGVDVSDSAGNNRTQVLINTTTLGAVPTSALGVTVATLVNGLIPSDQIPALAINDVFPVDSEAEMLALIADVGDVAIRSDTSQSFILSSLPASTLGNWTELFLGGGSVTSVNGLSGVVNLSASNVGAVDLNAVGAPNGVASLDGAGDVPDGQIPNNIARLSQVPALDIPVLTTVASATLTNEVVVGLTPGGELGGTWASPTVDSVHSGSSHAGIQAAAEATAAAALNLHLTDATDAHDGSAISLDPTNYGITLNSGVVNTQLLALAVSNLGASQISVDTGPFGGLLGPLDSNLQHALETLDDLIISAAPVTTVNTLTGDVVLTPAIIGAVDAGLLGVANGVATLDGTARLSFAQWPDVVFSINGDSGTVTLNGGSIPLNDGGWTTNLLGVNPDVQSVADAFDSFAGGAGSINASGFAKNLTTTDDTSQEVANKVDNPTTWRVNNPAMPPLTAFDSSLASPTGAMAKSLFLTNAVTLTATPTTIEQGTILNVHLDLDLNYTDGINGPNYALHYRPALWDQVNPTSSYFPRGAFTMSGTTTMHESAGLLATGIGMIDLRVTKNLSGAAKNISNYHAWINNHVFMADGAAISWAIPVGGSGGIDSGHNFLAMFDCYPSDTLVDQASFTPHSTNGGTLTRASHGTVFSMPLVYDGVTMDQRWGFYYEDTADESIGELIVSGPNTGLNNNWNRLLANGPGIIKRAVAIQIGEMVSATDYNLPFNYGPADVAQAPLCRIDNDGFVTTGAVLGLGNLLGINPAGTGSNGILVVDARTTTIGAISGYTHTTGSFVGLSIANSAPIVMSATTGGLTPNSFAGVSLTGTVSFTEDGPALGSAMFAAANTFKNANGQAQAMGTVVGSFIAPLFQADGANNSVTSVGLLASPTFARIGGAGTLTASITTVQSAPTVNDANVHVTGRIAVDISDITGSSGTIDSNIGINIAAFSRGTVKIGILNASTSVLSGGLYGGTTAAAGLTIGSTTNGSKGTITLQDATSLSSTLNVSGDSTLNKLIVQSTTVLGDNLEMRASDATLTSEPSWFVVNNAFTLNFASAAGGIYQNFAPTIINQQSANTLRNVVGYNFSPTVKNISSVAANFGPITGFTSSPTINADNQTGLTLSIVNEFVAGAAFTQTSSGALTTTEWSQFKATGSLTAGHTITTRRGVYVQDITGAGTLLGTNIGIDIEAQTKGATANIGLRNAAQSQLLGTTLIGGSTAPTNNASVVVQGSATYTTGDNRYMNIAPTITSGASAGDLSAVYIGPTFTASNATTSTKGLNVAPSFESTGTITTALGASINATANSAGTQTITELIGVQAVAQTLGANSTATTAIAADLITQEVLTLGTITTGVLLRGLTNTAQTKWGMQFGDFQSYHIGKLSLGSSSAPTYALDLKGTAQDRGVLALTETANAPTNPSSSNQVLMYLKADTLVFSFNDAGTMRYLSIPLTGTGTTWTHSTSAI